MYVHINKENNISEGKYKKKERFQFIIIKIGVSFCI